MVIKNSNTISDTNINELKNIILQMHELNSLKKDNFSDEKVRESLRLGNRFDKLLKKYIASDEGITKLAELLHEENPYVSFIAARYLYPIFPLKTMQIMKNYLVGIDDALEKMRVNDVIVGIEKEKTIFVNQFKKIYNCENLDSLNREKSEEND